MISNKFETLKKASGCHSRAGTESTFICVLTNFFFALILSFRCFILDWNDYS